MKYNPAIQTNILNAGKYDQSTMVWQPSFHEHIIRDERSYQNIAEYIIHNPAKWDTDLFHIA